LLRLLGNAVSSAIALSARLLAATSVPSGSTRRPPADPGCGSTLRKIAAPGLNAKVKGVLALGSSGGHCSRDRDGLHSGATWLNGASPNETFWLGEIRRETAFLADRVKLKFYNELSFEDILKDAANLP